MLQGYLKKYIDPLIALKELLSYPLCNFVHEFFTYTRNYESGLDFADYCYSILEINKDKLTDKEFEQFDKLLITLRLSMLDYLNRWGEYISYYENILSTKNYLLTYDKSRNDPDFNKYVVYEDERYKYVHFLYAVSHRYEIIKRKFNKWLNGKNVEHLKRHQQDRLSDTELQERIESIFARLDMYLRRSQNDK
ncbi:MAG: hypothetical protein PWQ70_3203 [Clostridiales bacterium]|jgi:hypothetical protein|nr:hypothetical protein [Clostridiales bacterium]